MPITLAISLHAPNDELRRTLIPWADNVTLNQLVEAAQDYFAQTHREITLEYILLRSVNDRPEHAHQLVRIARRLRCNVNLIRYNEVKDLPYERPISVDVHRFQTILVQAGVNTLIRASRGRSFTAPWQAPASMEPTRVSMPMSLAGMIVMVSRALSLGIPN